MLASQLKNIPSSYQVEPAVPDRAENRGHLELYAIKRLKPALPSQEKPS